MEFLRMRIDSTLLHRLTEFTSIKLLEASRSGRKSFEIGRSVTRVGGRRGDHALDATMTHDVHVLHVIGLPIGLVTSRLKAWGTRMTRAQTSNVGTHGNHVALNVWCLIAILFFTSLVWCSAKRARASTRSRSGVLNKSGIDDWVFHKLFVPMSVSDVLLSFPSIDVNAQDR